MRPGSCRLPPALGNRRHELSFRSETAAGEFIHAEGHVTEYEPLILGNRSTYPIWTGKFCSRHCFAHQNEPSLTECPIHYSIKQKTARLFGYELVEVFTLHEEKGLGFGRTLFWQPIIPRLDLLVPTPSQVRFSRLRDARCEGVLSAGLA